MASSLTMASSFSTNFNISLIERKALITSSSQCFLFNPCLCHHEADSKKHQAIGRSLPKTGEFHQMRSNLKTSSSVDPKRSKRDFAIKCSPDPSGLPSFLPPQDSWINWLWGLVVLAPFVVQRLLTMTKGVDMAAETVEKMAEIVEKVAEDVEKTAEDISETLPEGGPLKQVVDVVANVAKETEKDSKLAEDLMDKVEEVGKEIESIITNGSKSTAKDQED